MSVSSLGGLVMVRFSSSNAMLKFSSGMGSEDIFESVVADARFIDGMTVSIMAINVVHCCSE